ncbi:M56 family metallopeptidase [Microtetraspora malaysiensis]|uniref:M56 family metallopeptidase n=1 Tax=Microtetraspora malaysiensis TaxID=161358 RepID=UPI00082B279A|nr:M56 family metallopeptidase [Microtetraspora malaysiensis]
MTVALGLLVATVVIGVAGPFYLRTAVTPSVRPGLALAGWVSSIALMVLTALVAAVVLLAPRAYVVDGLIGMSHSCVNAVRADGEAVWEHVARAAGAAAVFCALAWVAAVAGRLSWRRRRWRREHLALLRAVSRCERSVLWVDEDTPLAYSVGGRDGAVVATRGVARLGPRERDAILSHERAHMRGRHHLLVLLADVVAEALPFVPLCRRAPGAIRVLVELAADAAAARLHGPGSVRAGLLAVVGRGAPSTALAMSRDAVEVRLRWLGGERAAAGRPPGRAGYALAAALALAPALVSIGVVALGVLAYCLSVRPA